MCSARAIAAAISGGSFYVSNAPVQFPPQYQGKYFFGDYVSDWFGYVEPTVTTPLNGGSGFASGAFGIVDIKIGPDGALYYLQRDTTPGVRRARPDPTQVPSIIDQPDNQTVFDGDDATFEVGQRALLFTKLRDGQDDVGSLRGFVLESVGHHQKLELLQLALDVAGMR